MNQRILSIQRFRGHGWRRRNSTNNGVHSLNSFSISPILTLTILDHFFFGASYCIYSRGYSISEHAVIPNLTLFRSHYRAGLISEMLTFFCDPMSVKHFFDEYVHHEGEFPPTPCVQQQRICIPSICQNVAISKLKIKLLQTKFLFMHGTFGTRTKQQ